MALPLFGGPQIKNTKNLIEFKAGKMTQKGKMVHPDARKGLVYIYKSDDSLTHFCWKDRTTSEVVDDLIIFPDDADFSRVKQCKTGRVYIMKFRSSNRRFFCWMQEPKETKDEVYCKKVNEILNGSMEEATPSILSDLEGIDQSTLMDVFGGATSHSAFGVQSVSPATVISKDAIETMLSSPDTVAKLEQHLPVSLREDPEMLRKTLNSTQFQEALQLFSSAFQSGQLAPLMKSLGFSDSAGNAAAGGDFEAFVQAAQNAVNENKKDDDDDMALD